MIKTRYFEEPTQVAFYNPVDERWLGGIAYQDFIICGECGHVVPVSEILEIKEVPDDHKTPLVPLKWYTISEEILGDLFS